MPLTDEQKAFVRKNITKYLPREIAEKLGVPEKAVINYRDYNHLKSGRHGGYQKGKCYVFPPEVEKFIQRNYKGRGPTELAGMINAKFGTSYTLNQVSGYCRYRHLDCGVTGQFEKGHVPYCKGKKLEDYCSPESIEKIQSSWFKKGESHNHVPIGKETPKGGKYIKVKVAEPNIWKLKHVLIWEQHYGPLKENEVVTFLDGNNRNFDISNLAKVTKEECMALNRQNLRYENSELTATGLNLVRLQRAINRRRKKNAKDEHTS